MLAAVGSYVSARHQGGQWLLRIEDIDPERCKPEHTQSILQALTAHGLHWDGEVLIQSQRHAIYHAHLQQLVTANLAYPCACTRVRRSMRLDTSR